MQLKDAAEVKPPPFITVDERRNRTWDGSLTGETPRLVQWAATQPIEDLTIGHPDLDSLFRRSGFTVEDLVELRPTPDAGTTYTEYAKLEWARKWPAEHIWVVRKAEASQP